MNNPLPTRFVRFVLTGLGLTLVHTLLAAAFIELVSPIPALANGLAFAAATVLSYLVNTHWSFSARLSGESFKRFLIVSVIGLVLAMLISWSVQLAGHHYLWGILAVAVSVPPVTFLLHNFWTYRP
jgi:putative flippase GtrA